MALLKFDVKKNHWYRSGRGFIAAPAGESSQTTYKTLKEAVLKNPRIPVENPATGKIGSVRIEEWGSEIAIISAVPDEEIENGVGPSLHVINAE